jgi:hypothetical protein
MGHNQFIRRNVSGDNPIMVPGLKGKRSIIPAMQTRRGNNGNTTLV